MDFHATVVSPRAIELATETLRSGWLSEGAKVKAFEAALTSTLGLVNPSALNSGTSALHLALAVAGVAPGDEVILPAQTFVATGLAILMQGAVPVFADVNPATGNLDPAAFERAVTPKTRAVMPVHWAGLPCDMDEINAAADRRGLAVIEDAAHALGATYKGKPIGAVSRFTAFSFQAIKHLTTGDGGALCCLDPEEHRAARRRRWFGIDREASRPTILGERDHALDELGYKYHMNDLAAAIGLGNLEDFPPRLARRREIARAYRAALGNVPGLRLLADPADRESARWLFVVLVERREDFIRALAARGVPASVMHLSIDRYALFGGLRRELTGQTEFNKKQVAIPVHDQLTPEDVDRVITAVKEGW